MRHTSHDTFKHITTVGHVSDHRDVPRRKADSMIRRVQGRGDTALQQHTSSHPHTLDKHTPLGWDKVRSKRALERMKNIFQRYDSPHKSGLMCGPSSHG